MGMGTRRRRQRQEQIWIAQQELAKGPAHPFYQRVNELLEGKKFDEFAERECAKFYAGKVGRPSLAPGIYFRLLLVGYFEGIDSERGIAWRAADSLGLRKFLGISIDEQTPDHSTISRTRRLIDVETHRKIFFWILEVLRDQGLVKGKTVGIDATTLEANAAMRSIVRRDTGESYEDFLKGLAKDRERAKCQNFGLMKVRLANCYFAHTSLRFPALLPFFNASSRRPFHPLHHYLGPLARTRRCPFRSCGVASS